MKAYQVNDNIPTVNGVIPKNSRLIVQKEGPEGGIVAEVIPPEDGDKWPLEAHETFIQNGLKVGVISPMPLPALTA